MDFKGILLVISNPVDAVTALYQEFTGWPKERVIGTGTLLDTARMKAAVGEVLEVNPKSVSGYNLGEHGNSQFTAWSQVKVKGQDITALTSEEERQNLFMASMKGGTRFFMVRVILHTVLPVLPFVWWQLSSLTLKKR